MLASWRRQLIDVKWSRSFSLFHPRFGNPVLSTSSLLWTPSRSSSCLVVLHLSILSSSWSATHKCVMAEPGLEAKDLDHEGEEVILFFCFLPVVWYSLAKPVPTAWCLASIYQCCEWRGWLGERTRRGVCPPYQPAELNGEKFGLLFCFVCFVFDIGVYRKMFWLEGCFWCPGNE